MMKSPYFVSQVDSTNNFLRELGKNATLPEGFMVCTDFQTKGKGQQGNSWESEKGKNLLVSILLYPKHISIQNQFILSQITSIAIVTILKQYADFFSIKWPNDIYWKDKKIGGILIENSLLRDKIEKSIVGIGLNINQEKFFSNAPNPIALKQITGEEMDVNLLLNTIHNEIIELYNSADSNFIHQLYLSHLYRKIGFHTFKDVSTDTLFSAKIKNVGFDGKLELTTDTNEEKTYYFKEVEWIL